MKKRSLEILCGGSPRTKRGSVSLETILIIGAIALPILIFLIMKWAGRLVKQYLQHRI